MILNHKKTDMSMKRSSLPQTNPSQGNHNYIQGGMGGGSSKHARNKVQRDSEEFQQFIQKEKKKAEARQKKP
ncbi:MAG: hypothetical protein RLZZ398_207 [Verrucomicrobiota bacterium]|jgi:hypothetical protein